MNFTVEASAFADAVQKAARVAPTKGHAFDAAAGIIVEVDPANTVRPLTIKSTDLESTFLATLPAIDVEGDAAIWRLPASILSGFMAQVPMGAGQTVGVEHDGSADDSVVVIRAGKTTARLRTLSPDSFPKFKAYSPDGMAKVEHFAQRVQQVAWTVADEDGVLGGVYVDGTHLTACNRYTTARVPCVVPVDEPIVVPLFTLSGAMKNTAEVQMRAAERRLYLMTDEDTQLSTVIFEGDYPDLTRHWEMVGAYEHHATIHVQGLVEVLQRMMVLCKSDRYPLVKLTIHRNVLRVEMDVPDQGAIDDELDIMGGAHDEPFVIWFTPTILTAALAVTKVPQVSLGYATSIRPIVINDGSGYECIAMPRQVS